VDASNMLTGATPLHCCLQHKTLSHGTINAKMQSKRSKTNRMACVRLLVQAGADWNAPDMEGRTPLDYYDEDDEEEDGSNAVVIVGDDLPAAPSA
jgi:Ankyrin repeat